MDLNCLTCYYCSGDAMRSRSVGDVVLSGTIDVPAPPVRLLADWQRESRLHLGLAPGEVEELPLVRARARWPDYRHCMQAMADWMRPHGLQAVLSQSDVALMVCRGARYHHDSTQYGGAAFCNVFLSEDKGLDVHFPATGHRIPLRRGTVVVFDTGQPHAVIRRGNSGFLAADFPDSQDDIEVFLTWELSIEDSAVGRALQVHFDTDPSTAALLKEPQLWRNGAQADVCPESGQWRHQPL
jgi:hypothetical protein